MEKKQIKMSIGLFYMLIGAIVVLVGTIIIGFIIAFSNKPQEVRMPEKQEPSQIIEQNIIG